MKFRIYNLVYFFKLAMKGMLKNGVMTLASIVILMSCLLVMGSSWAISENLTMNLNKLDGYNKIMVFVDKSADEAAVKQLEQGLSTLRGVTQVEFKSKDLVLSEQIEKYKENQELFQHYVDNNPLKDEFIVTYSSEVSINTLCYQIEQLENVDKINAHVETAEQIDSLKNVATLVLSWLMALLFVVSLFVIANTIKLAIFSRRDEIAIMRYVGATGFFVSVPFYIEGVLIGLLAGGMGYAVQYYLYRYFMIELLGGYEFLSVMPFAQVAYPLLSIFLGVGVVAGFVSSGFSLRKYNKV